MNVSTNIPRIQIRKMEKQEYLEIYRQMVLIRRVEEEAAQLYQQGKIGGFLHLYIGQEAVSTGVIAARLPQDRVITAYRDHGVAINVGIPAREVFAELLGKATGMSKGKGGSMHMADVTRNFWGGHAIVGAHLPIAAGMALGDQYMKSDAITICMFGDGATNIGFFHEALNLSKVWNLPVLWVCENNLYGMGTAVERASAVSEIRQKAEGYCMPNERVDGLDVLTVRQQAGEALKYIREVGGPFLLEIITYRYRGHSMGDPERYRQADEVKKYQENDPIGIYRRKLVEENAITEAELDDIESQIEEDIRDAIQFAENSPEPPPEALYEDIYADELSA
jgi:pyruvate dehydrogenase E1 component alpha subunit